MCLIVTGLNRFGVQQSRMIEVNADPGFEETAEMGPSGGGGEEMIRLSHIPVCEFSDLQVNQQEALEDEAD